MNDNNIERICKGKCFNTTNKHENGDMQFLYRFVLIQYYTYYILFHAGYIKMIWKKNDKSILFMLSFTLLRIQRLYGIKFK